MPKEFIARGQATISTHTDAYTLTQSVGEYVFPADNAGIISAAASVATQIEVTQDDQPFSAFTIGTVTRPAGFTSVRVDNTAKSVTFTVAAGTTTLADHGSVDIPVIIAGTTYHLSFVWSKVKAGVPGTAGTDANLLDWVKEWNTGRTQIDGSTVITPKLFAGVKNADGTFTGTAIGRYAVSCKTASGTLTAETVDGISCFKDGYKTFFLDNGGNAQLGRGDQFIKYNAQTGKVEFGSGVSLVWTDAIGKAKTEAINTAAADSANKIAAIKVGGRNYIRNSAFTEPLIYVNTSGTTVSIDASTLYNGYRTLKVNQTTACTEPNANSNRTFFETIGKKICSPASFSMYVKGNVAGTLKIRIGGAGIQNKAVTTDWQKITIENVVPTSDVVLFGFSVADVFWCALPMLVEGTKVSDWTSAPEDMESSIADAKKAGIDAKTVADAITNKANSEGWATKLTYVDKNGIFTGTLSANTVNTIQLNASQITSGIISAARIDVVALKASLITAGNIEALTLNIVRGKVGGWTLDADSIYRGTKSNTSGAYTATSGFVTMGSNGLRGYKWRLDATGAGAIAGGNIAWDAVGKVTFANSVAVAWQSGIDTAQELARAMTFGKMLYRDPTFQSGINNIKAYNNSGNGTVTVSRVANAQAPNDSGQVLEIATSGEASPGCGGFYFATTCAANKIFITRIIAKFPAGCKIEWASNAVGTSSQSRWLTPADGTGKWEEYIFKVTCGAEGTFQSTNFFYLNAASGVTLPLVWQVAYATVFDITASERYTTTIDANGIYTGVLTAGQITAGTLSADRIAAGSLKAEKLDAASIRASIINTDYINGLNCTFVRGKIGGWTIGADNITADKVGTVGAVPIQIRSAAVGSGYWYSGAYRPYGIIQTWHQNGNAGHLVFGQVAASGSTVKTDFIGLQMMAWDNSEYFCLSANAQRSGSKEVYNRIAGWAFDHQRIWKNNISLGAEGSITNGTKWKLNNDGSGQIASGNISWNAAGTVTFASSVSLNWTTPINNITTALGGATYPKLTKITSEGIYTGNLTAQQITAGTLSTDRLDAASIKSKIINAGYISGLACDFERGTIGGWGIDSDRIGNGFVDDEGGIMLIALNSSSSDSGGDWSVDGCLPMGTYMLWATSGNAGHLVMGQVADRERKTKTGFLGIQMMNWLEKKEYFCLAANYSKTGSSEVYNRIAGWAFDHERIWKNGVSLGADGSLTNGEKWQMNNDGSGRLASGNITWDPAGKITFSTAVSVAWTAGINAITTALGGSAYPKLTKITATGIYTGTISAGQISVDTALVVGGKTYNGSVSVRDASDNVKVTLDRSGITAVGGRIGGWDITATSICAASPASGHRVNLTSSGYIYNDNPSTGKDYWGLKSDGSATFGYGSISFAQDGAGYLANQNIKWDSAGNVELKGVITATGGKIAGFTISGNTLLNNAANSSIEFSSLLGQASLIINGNATGALMSLRADSKRTGIFIQTYAPGAKGLSIIANSGSDYAIESYGPVIMGQRSTEIWNVPGVLYIGSKYTEGYSSNHRKIWGDGVKVSSFTHIGSGQYKVVHNLRHTNYTVFAQQWSSTRYHGFYRLIEKTTTYFVLQNVGTEGKPDGATFDYIIFGQNSF